MANYHKSWTLEIFFMLYSECSNFLLIQPASQKRRPKGQKGGQTAPQMAPPQQGYYNDFNMQNQQQQNYMQNFGQPDMFFGGVSFL